MILFFVWILRERRVLSDDEIPAIKIVRLEKKEENNDDDDDDDDNDDEEDEDDDLQQYLKRKEARQWVKIKILLFDKIYFFSCLKTESKFNYNTFKS